MPMDDPSTMPSPFAERLSEALAASPLSLSRIRSQLVEAGLPVSTATLSYWSSGRSMPSRGRSREVVHELERILEVGDGRLFDALPQDAAGQLGALLGREEVIRAAAAEHDLLLSAGWKFLMAHRHVSIGADGANKRTATRQVLRATAAGLQGWTNIYDHHRGPVEVESLEGVHIRRDLALEGDLRAVEFVFDSPVERGECVMATTVLRHEWSGDVSSGEGYGNPRPMDLLVQEVTFAGDVPSQVVRNFTPQDGDGPALSGAPVRLSGSTVQMVLSPAAAGLHEFSWTW